MATLPYTMVPDFETLINPQEQPMAPALADAVEYATGQWNARIAGLERSFAAAELLPMSRQDYDRSVTSYAQQHAALTEARDAAIARAKRAANPQAAAVADADAAGQAAYAEIMNQAADNPAGANILHQFAVDASRRRYAAAYRQAGGRRDIGGPVTAELLDADLQRPLVPGTPGLAVHNNKWTLVLKGVKPSEIEKDKIPMFWGWRGAILRSIMAVAQEPVELWTLGGSLGGADSNEPMFVELASPLPPRLQRAGQNAARAILNRAYRLDNLDAEAQDAWRRAYNASYDDSVERFGPSIDDDTLQSRAEHAADTGRNRFLEQKGMLPLQLSPMQRLADAAIRFVILG